MQIIFVIVLTIVLLGFIIYKIDGKFGKKELVILIVVIIVSILTSIMFLRNEKEKVPELFKEKYEKTKGVTISKLSFERLNNKTVSSKTDFIYDFEFIINKDGKELVCKAPNIVIKKIEDEYIFENFNTMNEKCEEK